MKTESVTQMIRRFKKEAKGRDIEKNIEKYKHRLELVRTIGSLLALVLNSIIFAKVFHLI